MKIPVAAFLFFFCLVYFISGKLTNEIYIFFTSRDEIKVIFITKIRIFVLLQYIQISV